MKKENKFVYFFCQSLGVVYYKVTSLLTLFITYTFYNLATYNIFAQSAGAVEYTDCFSAEG